MAQKLKVTTKIPKPGSIYFEDIATKSVPHEWGYGSTPRIGKLRDALYWKSTTTKEWIIVAALVTGLCLGIPSVWQRIEALPPGRDYRIPYELSNDYWLYSRHCHHVCEQGKTLVIGDSDRKSVV